MTWLIKYDAWLRERTKSVLDWLYEWLSISQKAVERTMLYVYGISSAALIGGVSYYGMWIVIPILGIGLPSLLFHLIVLHRQPSATRTAYNRLPSTLAGRLLWQGLTMLVSFPPYKHHVIDVSIVAVYVTYTSFLYVISTNCDGERGRKRKLAWSELKKLFSWLPAAVPHGA